MKGKEIAYYLEDLNRVRSLSFETLGEWKEKYPYSQMVHFLMAKKYQLEGLTDDMSIFHKASFYAVDREHLYRRMTDSECERPDEPNWIEREEFNIDLPEELTEAESTNEEIVEEKLPILEVKSLKPILGKQTDTSLSPFAQWLNSLSSETIKKDKTQKSDKVKSKKKKKKKNKKKSASKRKLHEKIKSSVIVQDEIVSEPLALILAKQGHHEKAIKMYRKLSLIFPEKSGFFADQIEKINNSN